MGKSSSPPPRVNKRTNKLAAESARVARQLFRETGPIRGELTDQFTDLISTQGVDGLSDVQSTINPFIENAGALTVDPDTPALFGGAKAALEDQFSGAQDQLMALLPQGGSLNQGLIDLSGDRAFGLSQIMADLAQNQAAASERGLDRSLGLGGAQLDIDQRNIDRGLNLASGGTAGALQGFSVGGNLAANSAAVQASLFNSQQARQGAAKQGLGSAVGQIGSAAVKKCWVAREVYGEWNPKWLIFREWLFTSAPRWLLNFYIQHGERMAQLIKHRPKTKRIIRIFMDVAV